MFVILSMLKFKMNFYTDISQIDFSKLRTNDIHDYQVKETLELIILNVEKVIDSLDNGIDFKKENFKMDAHMPELIKFVEGGNMVIPPFIVNVNDNKWNLIDGKHRFALINYLGIHYAPFVIRKRNHLSAQQLI